MGLKALMKHAYTYSQTATLSVQVNSKIIDSEIDDLFTYFNVNDLAHTLHEF